jgi:hypothetical protein
MDPGVGVAASHGEVVRPHHDRTPIDRPAPGHEVRRREGFDLACGVSLGPAGKTADLPEAVAIEEGIDPFPTGRFAGVSLTPDSIGSAQLRGELVPTFEFLDLWLPLHGGDATGEIAGLPRLIHRLARIAGGTHMVLWPPVRSLRFGGEQSADLIDSLRALNKCS